MEACTFGSNMTGSTGCVAVLGRDGVSVVEPRGRSSKTHYSSMFSFTSSSSGACLPSTAAVSSRVFCEIFCNFLTNKVGYVVETLARKEESSFVLASAAEGERVNGRRVKEGERERTHRRPCEFARRRGSRTLELE